MRLALLLLLCLAVPFSNADGFLDKLSNLTGSTQPDFLAPDEAFGLDVIARDAHTLQANFSVTPSYYLYRDKITFSSKDSAIRVTAVNLPKGEIKHDPNFGDTEVFHQSFQALVTLDRVMLPANHKGIARQPAECCDRTASAADVDRSCTATIASTDV